MTHCNVAMKGEKHLSTAYKFLRKLGLNYPEEEYGQVSFGQIFTKTFKTFRDAFLLKFFMDSWLLSPLEPRKIRPWVLKKIGVKVGKDVFIGSDVWIDSGHADLIEIGDHVHVDARCILLCHKRDLSNYYIGTDYAKLPYKKGKIVIGKGCSIGTGTLVMPGVTIGEGTIVGAGSLITKDLPAWCVAIGRPAKAVKNIQKESVKNEYSDF